MRVALAVGAAVWVAVAGGAGGPAAGAPVKPSQGATAAAAYDFGDAPDGAPARYAEQPRVRGTFPSRAGSGGPRHPASGPRLGTGWSSEADSRQVDADADDGSSLNPRSCTFSTLNVVVDATRAAAGTPIYLNAWFDWNQDGDWRDGGNQRCRPEWAIQNMQIDPASLGADRIALLTLRFRAGQVPDQFWWRVQVHSGDPVPHVGSGGQASPSGGGETEDRLFSRIPRVGSPPVSVECRVGGIPANFTTSPHGDSPTFVLRFVGRGGATLNPRVRLSARRMRYRVSGELDGIVVLRRRDLEVPHRIWVLQLKKTLVHERELGEKQSVRIEFHVEALLNGRRKNYSAPCSVVLYHIVHKKGPPPPPPKTYKPAPRAGFAPKIDPVKAACRARFVPAGAAATVDVRCNGAHVRTISVSTSRVITRYTVRGTTWPGKCGLQRDDTLWYCNFRPNNKGQIIGIDYEVDITYSQGAPSALISVLAGGSETTPGGNTIVLRQLWVLDRNGSRLRCQQSIPSKGDCPPL